MAQKWASNPTSNYGDYQRLFNELRQLTTIFQWKQEDKEVMGRNNVLYYGEERAYIFVPKLSKPETDWVHYFTLKTIGNMQIK